MCKAVKDGASKTEEISMRLPRAGSSPWTEW
jgi:hypothetical protein